MSISYSASLLISLGLGGVGIGAFLLLQSRRSSPPMQARHRSSHVEEETDEEDIPEDLKDPITLSLIEDPVILCATGQLYSYQSIRDWFSNGGTLCPKTNVEVVDIHITRVPWMKERLRSWQTRLSLQMPDMEAQKRAVQEAIKEIHPGLNEWINTMRSDTGHPRTMAITELFKLLRQRESIAPTDPTFEAYEAKHRMIRDEVLEDCVWLLRNGDAYVRGVSCSILSYCDSSDEVSWLSKCASTPAVLLLNSPSRYSSQAATRLIYNIVRNNNDVGKRAVKAAGGVHGLVSVVKLSREDFGGFSRSRAAAALAELVRDDEDIRSLLLKNMSFLVEMIRSEDRFEVRDSATCISRLKVSEDDLALHGTSSLELTKFRYCSQAWLDGRVSSPDEGLLDSEKQSHRAWVDFENGFDNGHPEALRLAPL